MKKIYLLLVALLALDAGAARMDFDENWMFSLNAPENSQDPALKDSDWRVLNLPHDWSVEGKFDIHNPTTFRCGYLPAGIGWYRKTIEVPDDWKGKHVEIVFDGVFRNSTVWANGQKLGARPYGWISFAYDISEIVNASDSITFAVEVDNEQQSAARWYTGSGIYAHTWIDVKHKIHVPRDGIYVRTQGDDVELDVEVRNTLDVIQPVDVEV